MSKATFESASVFLSWLQNRRKDYEVYRTKRRIVAVPLVSTRPVIYGVYERTGNNQPVDDVMGSVRAIVGDENVYNLPVYTFDETRAEPGGSDE